MLKQIFVMTLLLVLVTPCSGVKFKHNRSRHYSYISVPKNLRRPFWHPMFPPTRASLLAQNEEIDRLGLPRIKDDQQLQELVKEGQLVPLPLNVHLTVDPHLPENRRYCRPWTAMFLTNLSDAYYEQFHEPIRVNSAVRTVEVQKKLRRWNPNAAPIEGETASSHLAGLTVDLERKSLTLEEAQFIEHWLLPLRVKNLVEVEEEYREFCFHIMVSGDYGVMPQQIDVEEPQLQISIEN